MPTGGRHHQQGDLAGQQVARSTPRATPPIPQTPPKEKGRARGTASGGGGITPRWPTEGQGPGLELVARGPRHTLECPLLTRPGALRGCIVLGPPWLPPSLPTSQSVLSGVWGASPARGRSGRSVRVAVDQRRWPGEGRPGVPSAASRKHSFCFPKALIPQNSVRLPPPTTAVLSLLKNQAK